MTDQDFARMAYREGARARIREALLTSVKAGDLVGDAHYMLVEQIRGRTDRTKTETDWLRRYNAAAFQRGLL